MNRSQESSEKPHPNRNWTPQAGVGDPYSYVLASLVDRELRTTRKTHEFVSRERAGGDVLEHCTKFLKGLLALNSPDAVRDSV